MMNTPRLRACSMSVFIGPAISPTRASEFGHQCLSHMSQIMMAVFLVSHCTSRSIGMWRPLLEAVSTCVRVLSFIVSAGSVAAEREISNNAAMWRVASMG